MKLIWIILIVAILQWLACNNPAGYRNDISNVVFNVKASAQPNSWYKIVITWSDKDTIRKNGYSGDTIRLNVPPGNDRVFHLERYTQDSVLTGSGTKIQNIVEGINNIINIELKPVYRVIFFTGAGASKVTNQSVDSSGHVKQTATPTRDCYEFKGWYNDTTNWLADIFGKKTWSFDSNTVNGDITLWAKWIRFTYTVAFNSRVGISPPLLVQVNCGDTIRKPDDPIDLLHPQSKFVGWYKDSACLDPWSFTNDKVTKDIKLYANWTNLPIYTITYDGNGNCGGTTPKSQHKIKGDTTVKISTKGDLYKTDYNFVCWNTKNSGDGKDYSEGAPFTEDTSVVLYAKWAPLTTFSVIYDGNQNDSGSVPGSQTKTPGEPLTISSNTGKLVKTGFTFAGWNTASDGSGTDYAEGASDTIDTNLKLFAKWTTLPTFSVTYNGNHNDSGSAPKSQTKTKGSPLILSRNTGNLAKNGYAFAGWNTTSDGSGTDYAEGASDTINANLELYAKWTQLQTYTVSYNGHGNTGGSAPPPRKKSTGDTVVISTKGNLVKTGYDFVRWNTDSLDKGTPYQAGAIDTLTANLTLYAIWKIKTYTVTFDWWDGNTPTTKQVDSGGFVKEPSSIPYRADFRFDEWYKDSLYKSLWSFDSNAVNGNITLYAKWIPTYTITYDANSGSGSVPQMQTRDKGDTVVISANIDLKLTDSVFMCWNTKRDGTGTNYAPYVIYKGDASQTLYAKWIRGTVTDYDGNVYQTVVLGNQQWTTSNLRTTKFNSGMPIPLVNDSYVWDTLTRPGYCYYSGGDEDLNRYGYLYNWYAVNTGNLAPAGWRVPSDSDWTALEHYLINNGYDNSGAPGGDNIAKAMAANTYWMPSPIAGTIGYETNKNNRSGFSAYPAGWRDLSGAFQNKGDDCIWWSATMVNSNNATGIVLSNNSSYTTFNHGDKRAGFSVRLVRDVSTGN